MADEEKKALEEIKSMNKSFDDLFDEPVTDPPAASDPPTTDAPVGPTSSPATDEPQTDAPTTDEPATKPPTTDAPDDRDQIIADLRTKLAEKGSTPKPTAAPTTIAPLSLESQDFIGDMDLEDLSSDKEALNKILNSVYSKGVTDSRSIIGDGVAKAIPSVVSSQIDLVTQMKETRDSFYSENEDLRQFPNVVSTVFDDLAKANPDEIYSNIVKAVAPEVRKRLNLPELKNEPNPKPNKGNPPRLPHKKGGPGRSKSKPNKSSLESELDAMNETLRR